MLWKICLKRFRWFIYCLILAVLFALPAASDGESGGAFGAIAFFIFVPAAFVAFVWAAYAAVRDIINVRRGGALPEDKPSVVSAAAGKLRDEAAVVNELDSHGRTKYFILRILGALLVIGGLALIIKDAVVIGTIVLIAGGALWIAASPKSFNETTDGMKMVPCPKEMTIEELYRGIRGMSTALGAPYIGRVKTIPGDTILFGPDADGWFAYVYKSLDGRSFYAALSDFTATIETPAPNPAPDAADGETETDYDGVLEEIYTAVKHCADRARTWA